MIEIPLRERATLALFDEAIDMAHGIPQGYSIDELEHEGIRPTLLIHDHHRKYPRSFDMIFESDGADVILTPLLAPRANAYAERWIGSCRRECLDRMLILSERDLRAVLREYCEHYNAERPHRARSLRPPVSGPRVVVPSGAVRRKTRLGGLLSTPHTCIGSAASPSPNNADERHGRLRFHTGQAWLFAYHTEEHHADSNRAP